MVKLRIFQLYEWDRIIYMDADMLVRKNLDHLFFLPDSSHIAGPRVYFQQFPGRPNYFCSCMMVFTPEKHMWDRILTWYKPDGYVKEEKLYDMDLLNREFIDEATVLPGIYEMLSAHLESEDEWKHQLKKVPYMEKKLGMPNKSWEEIYNATSVIHFTGLKPNLEKTLDMIKRKKPKSDSRFYAIYERYFTLASQMAYSTRKGLPLYVICSAGTDDNIAQHHDDSPRIGADWADHASLWRRDGFIRYHIAVETILAMK
ncbi:hypothetical protein THAOC_10222 [Thalassiosira oceanica]|uniref:Nucleotide-diphospho-sugar transferase domain-containing protein n=1 Tax=Thalassiosira oceanica TaxID=159749 RepID=K0SQL2_THAOC|nr:hypothetical protein THAOC_10222 [Thalassiosira oceanica]|eukprot:EJK68583.1 hypothetical protein THAOC_10222 [Thalassiosira oceanica]